MSKIYTVYKATSKVDGSVYVGVTGQPMVKRIRKHKFCADNGSMFRFHETIRLHGFHLFEFATVAECVDRSESWQLERDIIDETAATGAKMLNDRHGHGVSGFFSGKKHKSSSRQKISAAVAGTNHPSYDHTKHTFVHPEHGEEFCTRNELIVKFKLSAGSICNVLHGKRKSHKGWKLKETP